MKKSILFSLIIIASIAMTSFTNESIPQYNALAVIGGQSGTINPPPPPPPHG